MVLRIAFSLVLLISILFMPFWLSVILVFLGMIYFSKFYEGVILLLFSDLLYGIKEVRFFHMIFISLIVGILCLTLMEFLKKKLKFYNK